MIWVGPFQVGEMGQKSVSVDNRDVHQQKTLEFSEHTSLEAHNPCIITTQLLRPFSHRFSDLQPGLWSRVVTAELKDSTLNLLRSYDPKIQDIDLVLL